MRPGEAIHTKNLVLIDMDEVLVKAEDQQISPEHPMQHGYFSAFTSAIAEEFPEYVENADVQGGVGLAGAWYGYKDHTMKHHGPQDFAGLDAIWRNDPQNTEHDQFDPVNFFRIRLGIDKSEFNQWLHEMEQQPTTVLQENYLYAGAVRLWERVQATPSEETEGLILTQGGDRYQRHKAAAAFSGNVLARTQVMSSGTKGDMIGNSYNSHTGYFEWEAPSGLIIAERIAMVEDSYRHLAHMAPITKCLGILVVRDEQPLIYAIGPHVEIVRDTSEVENALERHNYLAAT